MKKFFGIVATFVACLSAFLSNANAGLIISADQGYLDRGLLYPNVGYVEGLSFTTGQYGPSGSGVLIHPNWVIAAAHQFIQNGQPEEAAYRVGFGANFYSNRGEVMDVTEIVIYPGYAGGANNDLAMLYFENPFATIAPMNIFADAVTAGIESDIVGYGLRQLVNETSQDLTGDRRAGNNVITGPDPFIDNGVSTTLQNSANSKFRQLGMSGRIGDSGGGLIIAGELAGITKSSTLFNGFGTATGYTLIDRAWVNSTIASRTAVPEPSAIVLLLSAMPAFGFLRKRRVA